MCHDVNACSRRETHSGGIAVCNLGVQNANGSDEQRIEAEKWRQKYGAGHEGEGWGRELRQKNGSDTPWQENGRTDKCLEPVLKMERGYVEAQPERVRGF